MLVKVLTFDCESTIYEQGNPFSAPNRLMCVGTLFDGQYEHHDIEYSGLPYNRSLERLLELFTQAETIVGFNLKYDLHWIRKYIPRIKFPRLYCCQLVEFILSNQRLPYPSLDHVATEYGLGVKLDIVRTEYWERGIDTPDVPAAILNEYLERDVRLTYDVYCKQQPVLRALPSNRQRLISLHNDDLGSLAEAEFNGMCFDKVEADRLAEATKDNLNDTIKQLNGLDDSYSNVNWNSGDHLSAVLYGGGINLPCLVESKRVLKSGEVKTRHVKGFRTLQFPRLVKPLPRTETLPTAQWSEDEIRRHNQNQQASRKPLAFRTYYTNQDVLRSISCKGKAREIVRLLLLYADLESLLTKGYIGIPKLQTKMQWEPNVIHGQFNQCVAVTGRLSSSKPNLQNFAGAIKPLFYSRFTN
jgi:DNA polymerase I-like protein with 3'-5' exonuclease and polymerase domains